MRLKYIGALLVIVISLTAFGGCINANKNKAKIDDINEDKNYIDNNFTLEGYTCKSGVLLGFRKDNSDGTSTYRTLWVAEDGSKLKCLSQGDFIMMPYKSTFLEFRQQEYLFKNNEGKVTDFEIGEAGKEIPKSQYTKEGSGKLTVEYKLNFVGNRYISYLKNTINKNNSETSISKEIYVSDFTKVSDERKESGNLNLMDAFNEELAASIINDTEKEAIIFNDSSKGINTTDGSNWTIERGEGRWEAKIAKTYEKNKNFKDYDLKTINLQIPKLVTAYDDLIFNYQNIKEMFPNIRDALTSPTKDILIGMYDDKIKFYPITSKISGVPKALTQPMLEINKDKSEKLIMVHWATYDYVSKWTAFMKDSLK